MQKIVFFLLYVLVYFVSRLPFWVLHRVSDGLYFVLFYVIGYRKKIVTQNLRYVFGEKSHKEIKKISSDFYRFFTDLFIEQIKSFSISQKALEKRFRYQNIEIFQQVAALNKSCIIIGGHYGNWEWACSLQKYIVMPCIGSYNKFSNPYIEKWVKKNRERFTNQMVRTSDTINTMKKNADEKRHCVYGLLSDQSPVLEKTFYWREFMGVEVPIHTGAEMLAKKYDCAVLFMHIKRTQRSQYEVTFEWLTENPRDFKDYELTDIFLEKIAAIIKKEPACYLWTHNRFKHKDKKHLCKNLQS